MRNIEVFRRFESLKNQFDYTLRNKFRWRRKGYALQCILSNDFLDLLYKLDQNETKRLIFTYHLLDWLQFRNIDNLLENFFYLEMLESAFIHAHQEFPDNLQVADIGVSHWFYVRSFYALLRWYNTNNPRSIHLLGYEIDPYRVYLNFYSRYDIAQAFIHGLPQVSYIPDKFTEQFETFHIITLLFPFVFIDDHIQWGLPNKLFQPAQLFVDITASLKNDGLLIIANQGKEEFFEVLNYIPPTLKIIDRYNFSSNYYNYKIPRFITIARKNKI